MLRLSLAALLVLALLLPGLPATAWTITLNGGGTSSLKTRTADGPPTVVAEFVNPTVLPFDYISTSVDGDASSESVYSLSNDAFGITFDHARVSTYQSLGHSNGVIFFSVDENIDYIASGSYSAVDSDGRETYLWAELHDSTIGSVVFENLQWSQATPNESFTLGGAEGDFDNISTGSLTGTLIAGHDYTFEYNVFIQADPTASASGAIATGGVALTFIPEPSTALLLGCGLVGFAARGRRRRA
jgi:hypothetical protein